MDYLLCINIHNNNDININQKNDAINNTDQKMNIEKDISKDNNSKNTNKSNINKNLDISKNINKINNPPKQEKNKENSKKINIEIMIPKDTEELVELQNENAQLNLELCTLHTNYENLELENIQLKEEIASLKEKRKTNSQKYLYRYIFKYIMG